MSNAWPITDMPLRRLRDGGEARALGPGGALRLVRVASGAPDGRAILFIHGFTGDPTNQATLIRAARARGMEVWVAVYDTINTPVRTNGAWLAAELAGLARSGRRDLTVVAHSLGALTFKAGLDRLSTPFPFTRMRVVAVSVPWRGLRLADQVLGCMGNTALPPLVTDLAPDGPTLRALAAHPWPRGVSIADIGGSADPLRWLEAPSSRAHRFVRRRAVLDGASHNTILWDPRTVALVFGGPPPALAPQPAVWKTLGAEAAAILGLPGAFDR